MRRLIISVVKVADFNYSVEAYKEEGFERELLFHTRIKVFNANPDKGFDFVFLKEIVLRWFQNQEDRNYETILYLLPECVEIEEKVN